MKIILLKDAVVILGTDSDTLPDDLGALEQKAINNL